MLHITLYFLLEYLALLLTSKQVNPSVISSCPMYLPHMQYMYNIWYMVMVYLFIL